MDYRLKSLYEQMLKGETAKQASKVQPKNLQEAYKKTVMMERVGLYAKPIGQNPVAPDEPGMETLGVADSTDFVQQALNSVTIKPATDELLLAAGKWQSVDDYEDSLKLPIAMEFAKKGLSSNDVQTLIKEKSKLTRFVNCITKETPFNATKEVVVDLKTLFPANDNLEYLVNYTFLKKPKISDVGVGMGEVALTIFTNCVKGKVGDLDTIAGPVEVKSSRGRLASPKQINSDYAKSLAQFLIDNKATQATNRHLHTLKHSIQIDVDDVLNNEKYKDKFTLKFINFVKNLASKVDSRNFETLYFNSVFASRLGPKGLYELYLKNGFISFSENIVGSEKDMQQTKNVWSAEMIPLVEEINKTIKAKFTENVFKKSSTQGVSQTKLDYALATQKDIKDIATATTPLEALEEFYFTNFGLTAEQKADALTLIVSEQYRPIANSFKSDIVKFFNEKENLFRRGSSSVIKAIVFAMQVSVYAYDHFKYLLIIDKETKNARGFETSSFYNLATKYLDESSKKIGFTISIDINKERGGSAVDFGGVEELPASEKES